MTLIEPDRFTEKVSVIDPVSDEICARALNKNTNRFCDPAFAKETARSRLKFLQLELPTLLKTITTDEQ